MKTKAIFYHAGCPVCVAAEHSVANALDPSKYTVESVHLGTNKSRVKEAEAAGVACRASSGHLGLCHSWTIYPS